MPSVRIHDLRKSFGSVVAVNDVTLEFQDGALTSVLGPSGCGKTTTLNLIAGFDEPDRGTIYFGDRVIADPGRGIAVPPNRRNLGMVFQSYALWPHLTVGENVAYGLKMHGVARAERDLLTRRALQSVRLDGYLARYPHELSGGQQQRVALARAIAYSPQTILFDEPLSNLDAQLREEMRIELKEVHRRIGVTAIYVTHDQAEALALSDRIVVMGEGRVRQVGTPRELYEEPADVEVARFLRRVNIFNATLMEKAGRQAKVHIEELAQTVQCRCAADARNNARGAISIRPERIRLRPLSGDRPGEPLTGRVRSAIYLGSLHQYRVAIDEKTFLDVEQSGVEDLHVDHQVVIEIDPEGCYFIAETLGATKPGIELAS
jgi:iron(III) transport system ATP-binding protein